MVGTDGQPGFPGNNGGYFTGYSENPIDLTQLTVIANGGVGGNGGNGGNGGSGSNGTNGHDPDNTSMQVGAGTPYTYNIGWHGIDPALCEYTLNGTRILYQNLGTPGTSGGNGGHAGRGGRGGHGGIVKWKLQDSVVQFIGHEGANGHNGTSGTGGRGGRNGSNAQRYCLTNMTCTAVAGGPMGFIPINGTHNVPNKWEQTYYVNNGNAADGNPGQLSNVLPQDPPAQMLPDTFEATSTTTTTTTTTNTCTPTSTKPEEKKKD